MLLGWRLWVLLGRVVAAASEENGRHWVLLHIGRGVAAVSEENVLHIVAMAGGSPGRRVDGNESIGQ